MSDGHHVTAPEAGTRNAPSRSSGKTMPKALEYSAKFESFKGRTLYGRLDADERAFIREIAFAHRFTFQELRRVVEVCRDLSMWGEGALEEWWRREAAGLTSGNRALKRGLLGRLEEYLDGLTSSPPTYPSGEYPGAIVGDRAEVRIARSDKKIFGMCPVASPKTVCCQLRTIDAVEGCPLACSYCSIRTFYRDEIVVEQDLAEKLRAIPLEWGRLYHFGSGQSSDALALGNTGGHLDALCEFARRNPNVILELKTKSTNIGDLMGIDVPRNVVCSWSLNTPTIVRNEEHLTASLEHRLRAARDTADRGLRVGFHFHPMVHYEGWDADYPALASAVVDRFDAREVAFLSLGSVTLIKPAVRKIRELGRRTKILQAKFTSDPHGRLTYPDETKIGMFRRMLEAFAGWRDEVFMYLCMEKREVWEGALGRVYESNDEFETDFCARVMTKLTGQSGLPAATRKSMEQEN